MICLFGLSSAAQAGPLDSCETESSESPTAPLHREQLPWITEVDQTLQCSVSLYPALLNPKTPASLELPRSAPLANQVLRVSSKESVARETSNLGVFFKEYSGGASRETWIELHGRMDPRPRKEEAQFSLHRRSRRGNRVSPATALGKTQIIRGKGSTDLFVEGYRLHVSCVVEGKSGQPVDGRGGG